MLARRQGEVVQRERTRQERLVEPEAFDVPRVPVGMWPRVLLDQQELGTKDHEEDRELNRYGCEQPRQSIRSARVVECLDRHGRR